MTHSISRAIVPNIRTKLPGPLAAALIQADEIVTSPSYTRMYPLAVKRGEGCVIEDLDGNLFLDFTAGIAVCATGHCHERVVSAIEKQARTLLHMSGTDFYYPPQAALAQKLAQIAPGEAAKKVFFTNSGAEAVEAAFKLARHHTGRPHVLAFHGAFHGRTFGAMSLTGSKVIQRQGFGPLVPQVTHVPYGDCYRCPLHLKFPECEIDCVPYIERTVFRQLVSPSEVAAIFVEPIQGEGGYVTPPPQWHRDLKALAERHGILFIADEIQSGMGRTGRMFAIEHYGVAPDIVCVAKGLASGLPLGAIVARADVMTWPRGSHASTFGGNPVACVAALETIALLEESLIDNAREVGSYLEGLLRQLASEFAVIGDVRGKGLMLAIDLVQHPSTREPHTALRDRLIQACFHRGLLLLGCGQSAIRFCPPLIITRAHADTAVRILAEALRADA